MGFLEKGDQRQLCKRLEELPGAGADWASVRATLLRGLPAGVALNVGVSRSVRADIMTLVETLEGPGMQLADGRWPIMSVIENAMDLSAGLLLEQRLHELLTVAVARRNAALAAGVELEALINRHSGFQSVAEWARRLYEVIPAICLVEVGGRPNGTGFLVGPNLVLTNFHVTHGWSDGGWRPYSPQQIRIRFDYYLHSARDHDDFVYEVVAEALPQSPFAELDFALLRVKGTPAADTPGGMRGAAQRGYLALHERQLVVGEPLFIVQHPQGRPMEIAFDLVTDVRDTRVLYKTNTEPGSSGSPCFDKAWNVVALHHASNEAEAANQAVPISLIAALPEVRALLA